MTEQPVEITEWRPMRRNNLLGFASVRMRNLEIYDCPVLQSGNRKWIAMPSKPRLDRDGRQMKNEDGKALWSPVIGWRTRDSADRFSAAVLAELVRRHPDALLDDSDAGR